jgi:amidase
VAPSADTIPTVIGPISVSLTGIELFMSTILAAKPWFKDPSLNSLPWRLAITEPTPEEPLRIGVLWHDDEVLPHPPITRALKELIARVRANSQLAERVEFVNFPAHRHAYGWSLLSKLYYSDGGAADRATAALSGEPLSPLLEWLLNEPEVKRLTRSQLELALEDREAFREEYAHHWNAVGIKDEEEKEEQDQTLPIFEPYKCKVDVLICPVAPYIASPHGKAKYWSYTSLWNLLDYPALSLPTLSVVNKEKDWKPDRKNFMSSVDEEMWDWCRFLSPLETSILSSIANYSRVMKR